MKGATERTSTDKLRARREKKVRQREKFKRKAQREAEVAKLNPALGNKYAKEKALRQLTKMSEHGDDVTIIQVRSTFSLMSYSFYLQEQERIDVVLLFASCNL